MYRTARGGRATSEQPPWSSRAPPCLAIPGGASASSVNCSGKLALDNQSDAGPRGVRYHVKCSEDILAYSIHVSKKIDYFTPDPITLTPAGNPAETGKPFFCEGPIPGPGFGCPGEMTTGNRIVGSFGTSPARCNPTVRAWVTVTTEQLTASGSPFITISHPRALLEPRRLPGPGCEGGHHRFQLRNRLRSACPASGDRP